MSLRISEVHKHVLHFFIFQRSDFSSGDETWGEKEEDEWKRGKTET